MKTKGKGRPRGPCSSFAAGDSGLRVSGSFFSWAPSWAKVKVTGSAKVSSADYVQEAKG